jgi:hypothetical protein
LVTDAPIVKFDDKRIWRNVVWSSGLAADKPSTVNRASCRLISICTVCQSLSLKSYGARIVITFVPRPILYRNAISRGAWRRILKKNV